LLQAEAPAARGGVFYPSQLNPSADAMQKVCELLEAMPCATVMADSTGRIVYVNARATQLFGRAPSALLGSSVDLLLVEADRGNYHDRRTMIFAHAKRSGAQIALEAQGRRRAGAGFPLLLTLSVLETEQGPCVLNVFEDRSEMARLQRALRDSGRVKSEFFAHMSHELRTPLNGIVGFAEFLLDGKPGPLSPQQQEYLGDILGSGRRLSQLIDEVVELSRVDSGALELRAEAFWLPGAIEEACAAAAEAAALKKIRLHRAVAPGLGSVMLDRARLLQVLNYLIANAIKFSSEGREIHVSAAGYNTDALSLRIWDEGSVGRSAEMDKLLADYPQLEASAIRRYGSRGLDLVLAQKIVEAQQGLFAVEPQGEGAGGFSILLPCVFVAAATPPERLDAAWP
jgi:PAS domain S-box-containing protein